MGSFSGTKKGVDLLTGDLPGVDIPLRQTGIYAEKPLEEHRELQTRAGGETQWEG